MLGNFLGDFWDSLCIFLVVYKLMLEILKFEVWNNWLCRNKCECEFEFYVYIVIVCENLYYIGVGNFS